jgi:hypothetical protein
MIFGESNAAWNGHRSRLVWHVRAPSTSNHFNGFGAASHSEHQETCVIKLEPCGVLDSALQQHEAVSLLLVVGLTGHS